MIKWTNGNTFIGEFWNNQKIKGTLNFYNGDKYIGEFWNN